MRSPACLVERLRTASQRDEAALLRDYIRNTAAAPDRPAPVACGQMTASGNHGERRRETTRRRTSLEWE